MKLKSLSIHKQHFLKDQLPKLALSLSLFSILLSAWIIPCLHSAVFNFNPFDHQISKFPLRLFTHGVDKTHMFLLCNGILVFLAKSSGMIGQSRGTQHREGGWRPPELHEEGVLVFENEMISAEEAGEDVGSDDDNEDEEGEEVKEVCKCCSDECREKEAGINLGIRVEESDVESELDEDEECVLEAGSGHGIMTAEEMDRKFDDFIRRIREEISIGSAHAQQQQQQPMMIA